MKRKWWLGIVFLCIFCMVGCGRDRREQRTVLKEQLQGSQIERLIAYQNGQRMETSEKEDVSECETIVKHLHRGSFSEEELARAGNMDLTLQCEDGKSYRIAVNGPEDKTLVVISQDDNTSQNVEEETEYYTIGKDERRRLEKLYEKIVEEK